jgi:3-oxoacyl-[acyl-carrier-protein] synthase-3
LLSFDAKNIELAEMSRVGHVFGADPFLNLAAATATTDCPYALLVASGIAGAFGAALMRRCL